MTYLYTFSCSHGMTQLNDDEIIKDYGEQRLWPLFDILKKTLYHGGRLAVFVL